MLTLKEILRGDCLEKKFIPDFNDLAKTVNLLREGGFKIVLTQGVYDMIHVGHIRYLAAAREFGDVLIVGVDSDELTREMKGPNRPFDEFNERIEILSALPSVSVIARRHTDQDKYDLIKLVRPDVLVMSKTTSSFTQQDVNALSGFCGHIEHLEAKASNSTTAKIRRLVTEGAQELAKEIQQTVSRFLARNGGGVE